jgi:uncharacterized protein YcbK (DUF882 family)
VSWHRRGLLKYGLGAVGAAAFGAHRAAAAVGARSLAFTNLHTGESLQATYWEAGDYVPDALGALNHLMRDFRTGDVHPIAPDLYDLVYRLQGRLETRAPVQVISGYRSPATNAALHARSEGVASHSLHMLGQATDIRIAGVELSHLRDAALSLGSGGVGFYPQSQFVHVDVGRVRTWKGA